MKKKMDSELSGGSPETPVRFNAFDAPLDTFYDEEASRELGKRYWRVLVPFRYYTGEPSHNTWVEVPYGYLTDGATVPRPFWWLIPPWGKYGQAAVLHDVLCETLTVYWDGKPSRITRARADSLFKQAMKSAGVARWKRNVMYICVRVFSKLFRGNDPVVLPLKRRIEADWVKDNPPGKYQD